MPRQHAIKAGVELKDLVRQVARARAVLSQLCKDIADAQHTVSAIDRTQQLAVNERISVAAMKIELEVDVAVRALTAIENTSQLDELTQLPNRSAMEGRFVQAIAHAKRYNTGLALLFIDLDGFKLVNDSLGHAAGDHVLRVTARRLLATVRNIDTVSRYGGDEFLVLLAEVIQDTDATLVAEKIARMIAKPVTFDGHTMGVSASIGICFYPDDGAEPHALIRCADEAMYRTKLLRSAAGRR